MNRRGFLTGAVAVPAALAGGNLWADDGTGIKQVHKVPPLVHPAWRTSRLKLIGHLPSAPVAMCTHHDHIIVACESGEVISIRDMEMRSL